MHTFCSSALRQVTEAAAAAALTTTAMAAMVCGVPRRGQAEKRINQPRRRRQTQTRHSKQQTAAVGLFIFFNQNVFINFK
jgi:hypothetical protein